MNPESWKNLSFTFLIFSLQQSAQQCMYWLWKIVWYSRLVKGAVHNPRSRGLPHPGAPWGNRHRQSNGPSILSSSLSFFKKLNIAKTYFLSYHIHTLYNVIAYAKDACVAHEGGATDISRVMVRTIYPRRYHSLRRKNIASTSFIRGEVQIKNGIIWEYLPSVGIVFLLVRSCILITLIKCLKGHKSLASLFEGVL